MGSSDSDLAIVGEEHPVVISSSSSTSQEDNTDPQVAEGYVCKQVEVNYIDVYKYN